MATLAEKINDLNDLIREGKSLEAFEKYYHEDVVMQENENPPTIGKSANRTRENGVAESLTEFREAKPLNVTVGEKATMVEWYFDYTHKDWGAITLHQVAVQEWKDGQIIKEKFYYDTQS